MPKDLLFKYAGQYFCTVERVSVLATGGAALPSSLRARWERGLRAGAPAAPAAAAGHRSSHRPPRQTEGTPEGPAAPDLPSEPAFLSRWEYAALVFPSTYMKCIRITYTVYITFSNVHFSLKKKKRGGLYYSIILCVSVYKVIKWFHIHHMFFRNRGKNSSSRSWRTCSE